MNAKKSAMALCVLFLSHMSGCALIPTEQKSVLEQRQRESVAGKTTTDVVTAAKISPPNVVVQAKGKDGLNVTITQPVQTSEETAAETTANEDSKSSASGSMLDETSIPLWFNLIMMGVAVVFLVIIVGWMRKKSRAFNAVVEQADGFMDGIVHRVRSEAITTTDPHVTAKLQGIAADIERDRVKFQKE